MLRVLGIGDNVCDVYLHRGIMYPGGQALNFAVYAKKLGAAPDFMGVFGNDAVAEHVKKTPEGWGIFTSYRESEPGYVPPVPEESETETSEDAEV